MVSEIYSNAGRIWNGRLALDTYAMPPLPLRERSDRIARCDPGEGLRSIERPEPLTPTLSRKGRGSSLPMPRFRTSAPTRRYLSRPHDPGSQRHQALECNHHVVAGLQVKLGRVGLTDRDAARRAHRDQIAGLEHDVAGKVLQHVGDLVEIIAGVGAQPPLAVDVAGDPEIIGVGDFIHGQNERTDRPKARHVLRGPEPAPRGDLALLDFAGADIVGQREAADVI